MRIGVDATSWFNERGYGRFTRELLTAMVTSAPEHEFVCFVDARDLDRLALTQDNVRPRGVRLSERPAEAASADGSRSVRDMLRMTRAVGTENVDVLFYPTVYSFFPAPLRHRVVVAVHDTIAERFPELTLPSARARLFWRWKVRLALWQARLVLTVSEFSARDIEEVLKVGRDRIRVTHEAPAAAYCLGSTPEQIADATGRVGIPPNTRYLTYVGGFNPHKNVESLVAAHAALAAELEDPPRLLLVGTLSKDVFHIGVESIRAAVRRAGTEDQVVWAGFVPDEKLRHLHAGSLAVVLPSECEGFGLPAAEAAACGTPIVATTQSPLPELFAGGGLFVDPGDHDALLGALRVVCTDEARRSELGARAAELAQQLTWSSAAALALDALMEASR